MAFTGIWAAPRFPHWQARIPGTVEVTQSHTLVSNKLKAPVTHAFINQCTISEKLLWPGFGILNMAKEKRS